MSAFFVENIAVFGVKEALIERNVLGRHERQLLDFSNKDQEGALTSDMIAILVVGKLKGSIAFVGQNGAGEHKLNFL